MPLVERFEFRTDIDPDLLMYSLYYKTFLADPSDALPDLGPLAGYSPLRRDMNKPQGLAKAAPKPPPVAGKPPQSTRPGGAPPTRPPRTGDGGLNVNIQPRDSRQSGGRPGPAEGSK